MGEYHQQCSCKRSSPGDTCRVTIGFEFYGGKKPVAHFYYNRQEEERSFNPFNQKSAERIIMPAVVIFVQHDSLELRVVQRVNHASAQAEGRQKKAITKREGNLGKQDNNEWR